MTHIRSYLNIDDILAEDKKLVYKNRIKKAILDFGFEENVTRFLCEVVNMRATSPMEFMFCPENHFINETDDFTQILEESVRELLVSEKYTFNIVIKSELDRYCIKVGMSPK